MSQQKELPSDTIVEPSKEVISQPPKEQSEMQLHTPTKEEAGLQTPSSDSDSRESDDYSLSDVGSGYDRDSNECTEFCIELVSCFGVLDACCPSSGEGFFTTCATFCGNILFSCCKCA